LITVIKSIDQRRGEEREKKNGELVAFLSASDNIKEGNRGSSSPRCCVWNKDVREKFATVKGSVFYSDLLQLHERTSLIVGNGCIKCIKTGEMTSRLIYS